MTQGDLRRKYHCSIRLLGYKIQLDENKKVLDDESACGAAVSVYASRQLEVGLPRGRSSFMTILTAVFFR